MLLHTKIYCEVYNKGREVVLVKKIILMLLILIIAMSCTKTKPKDIVREEHQVTIVAKDFTISQKIEDGKNFIFTMPHNSPYKKAFTNNTELLIDKNGQYVIENILEDVTLIFKKQYKIFIPHDLFYNLEIINSETNLILDGDSIKLKLTISSDFSDSKPILKANGITIKNVDGYYEINNIQENINITIEKLARNEIKPIPDKVLQKNYSNISNQDLSWWYRPSTNKYVHIKPTIDKDIHELIENKSVFWILDTNEKKIVLTMDEGYENGDNTKQILDIAKAKNVPITFFITGGYLENNLDLVKRMVAEGHVVANHSNKHLRASPALENNTYTFINDINDLAENYKSLMGSNIARLYRPPEGGYSERSLAIAEDMGYKTIFWSFAYRDWLQDEQPNPEEAFNTIISNLHPGAIILLHAVSNTNVSILEDLIDEIRNQGYSFTTIKP